MTLLLPLATRTIARIPSAVLLQSQHRGPAYICQQCRHKSSTIGTGGVRVRAGRFFVSKRPFSASSGWGEAGKEKGDVGRKTTENEVSKQDTATTNDTVHMVPDEILPSHRETLRWRISKQVNKLMDDLMPKLAVASQRINNYTGTDYTGIEALRKEIIEQEKLVQRLHASLQIAKESYETSRAQEIKSRKEVVSLLERRHSWADSDLERYMSLIRSEHLNDQAVQSTKDEMTTAERALEEARSRLEKRERMQYHEEQIWSDTIRRNSTWVTFGLMGVNILLLLSTMVLIEPWRRRRIVREIREALEANRVADEVTSVVEEIVDVGEPEPVLAEVVSVSEVLLEEAAVQSVAALSEIIPVEEPQKASLAEGKASILDSLKLHVADLFSERQVSVRKVDISTIVIEGAAVGATVAAGILLILLRPR